MMTGEGVPSESGESNSNDGNFSKLGQAHSSSSGTLLEENPDAEVNCLSTGPNVVPSSTDFVHHFVIRRQHPAQSVNEAEPTETKSQELVETSTITNTEETRGCEAIGSSAVNCEIAKCDENGKIGKCEEMTVPGESCGSSMHENGKIEKCEEITVPGESCGSSMHEIDNEKSSTLEEPTTPLSTRPLAVARIRRPRVLHPFMTSLTPKPQISLPAMPLPSSSMDSSYGPISSYCIQNGLILPEAIPFKCNFPLGKAVESPLMKTLKVCGQRALIPIKFIFNELRQLKKIGEGVYGEVYSGNFHCLKELTWVYKVVPIEGDAYVNGERQRKFMEILPEILISQTLNELRVGFNCCQTDGYVHMRNARIAVGSYPSSLVDVWEDYNKEYESDNDKPNFPQDQLYMILEFDFAGHDIETINFKDARQTLSVVLQVAHILAVGECAFEFEHRDLHWGNIMVNTWNSSHITYTLCGEALQVPSHGIKVVIIDFTMARLLDAKRSSVICLDIQDDEEQFLGTGDHQFDIYRMMRDHNRNDWLKYCPKSNVFWLHYLANKFLSKGRFIFKDDSDDESGNDKQLYSTHHKRATEILIDFSHSILQYQSACDFVRSEECKTYNNFLEVDCQIKCKL